MWSFGSEFPASTCPLRSKYSMRFVASVLPWGVKKDIFPISLVLPPQNLTQYNQLWKSPPSASSEEALGSSHTKELSGHGRGKLFTLIFSSLFLAFSIPWRLYSLWATAVLSSHLILTSPHPLSCQEVLTQSEKPHTRSQDLGTNKQCDLKPSPCTSQGLRPHIFSKGTPESSSAHPWSVNPPRPTLDSEWLGDVFVSLL